MRSSALRTIRIIFSILVLISISFAFIDLRHLLPAKYFNTVLSLQFVPSVLKFIGVASIAAGGFIVVLILTLLTGRTYCSFLCPLGILQDIFSRTGGRIKKRFRRFGYKKPFTILRYSILAVTLAVSFIWGIYLLTLLDPYSIFGRIMTFFVMPAALYINNFLAGVLGKFDIYTFTNITVKGFPLVVYAIPVTFLLLVGVLSFTKGRLYCNTVCPVGTFLGLISKISLLRIRFDDNKCTRCGRCAIACKSSCIDFLNKKVDVTRCVDCFNCIKSCPDKALYYRWSVIKKKENAAEGTDERRRGIIAGMIFFLFGISEVSRSQGGHTPVPAKKSTVKEARKYPVCPPGATRMDIFNNECTACSLCITACPNKVLQPSFREYGISGIMQPRMDYHKSFCTYNCVICTEVCPTNALHPLALEAKKLTQLGIAVFIKENCVVNTEKTACGACSESCPTKACHMVPFEGNLVIPEVTNDLCIGCGHCEYACPTTPFKAIFVDGNPVHLAAKKPVPEEAETKKHEEFPF
jgi:polyferredoxin